MATHDELDWNVSPGSGKKNTGDINTPNYSPRKPKEDNAKPKIITGLESTTGVQDETEPEPVEYQLSRAYFKESEDGYGFNKNCIVVVEGYFLKKTIRTRIQGQLFCESDAGLEDLGSYVEGHADKNTGTAELEVTLYVGPEYEKLTASTPDAKCRYILREITHSRGDRVIESEPLEMPTCDVNGYGGIWFHLVDESGVTVTDQNANVRMDEEVIHDGRLDGGEFKIDEKPPAKFSIEIGTETETLTLPIPWQRSPLIEQLMVIPTAHEETAGA